MVMATAVLDNYVQNVLHNHIVKKKPQYLGALQNNVAVDPKQLIGEAFHQRVRAVNHELCDPGEEDTFFVADLGEVYRQHLRWKRHLPRIKPFYAVKCNPDPKVLQLLAALGTGFDCASKGEIEQVLGLGVSPNHIIYAQPCKTNSYVRYVKSMGVKQMTFDNADELQKIAKLFPGADLFLRIMTDDTSSLCRLSMKFGAPMDTTDSLLALAKELGLNIVGVSFHVGSGASDPAAFRKAVVDAHTVFRQARAYGFHLRVLDVGGGFCGETFETMAAVLDDALAEFFPSGCGVDIIAEPGRFYVATAFTIACNIIARRTVDDPSAQTTSYMAYINDGVYGNFSSIMFDHQHPVAKILYTGGQTLYNTYAAEPSPGDEGVEYSIWGPTCDGIDLISQSTRFNHILDVGDWLYFENMGAYTKCSATQFNGFSNAHDTIYVCSEPGAKALLDL
ncbi:pyridoxal-dependent decarboxylase [Trichoderma novae-zelandiae]